MEPTLQFIFISQQLVFKWNEIEANCPAHCLNILPIGEIYKTKIFLQIQAYQFSNYICLARIFSCIKKIFFFFFLSIQQPETMLKSTSALSWVELIVNDLTTFSNWKQNERTTEGKKN